MITHKRFALDLAAQAGKLMLENFRMGMSKTTKDDLTPVTEVDLAINKLLITEAQKHFPDYGILAEEESVATDHKYVWVCDPIDGTIAYSHGIAIASFSLALVQNGEPVLGLVSNPFQNNLYFAEKGQGAYLNDQPIRVSDRTELSTSLVFVEHWREAFCDTLPVVKALERIKCYTTGNQSIANAGGLVAAGEAAGFVFPGTNAWDVAAAKIIIEEAGGVVTDFKGQAQKYDGVIHGCIAGSPVLHKQLLEFVDKEVFNKA